MIHVDVTCDFAWLDFRHASLLGRALLHDNACMGGIPHALVHIIHAPFRLHMRSSTRGTKPTTMPRYIVIV